jgi:hypothetical protein
VKAQETCIEFILKGRGYPVLQSLESFSRAALSMAEYRNVPVDFADAALVVLAEVGGSMKFSRCTVPLSAIRESSRKGQAGSSDITSIYPLIQRLLSLEVLKDTSLNMYGT